ncbi:MAG TPA: SIMPL domain-containing protein [Methylocella sp.]|nr:SIMPL domain-containing protein [Methylocella sp.]
MRHPRSVIFFAMFAAAAVSAPSQAQQNFYRTLKESVPSITTAGSASTEVVPDVATLTFAVETERPNAADAARENARAGQATVADIKAQGIESKDIKTVAMTLLPVFDETLDANGRVAKRTRRGFAARTAFSVRLRDISRVGALAAELIDKGANSFEGIDFDVSQREARYEALRGEAARDALRKANNYVNGLGVKLGRVLEVTTQPQEPRALPMAAPRLAAAREAGTPISIEPGVETLRAEVQVVWEIAQ